MQFYIREAWLLDERQFKEWLDIFTDDVLYFMPRRKNVLRRELHREVTLLGDLAILEEDKRYLEMRVARLETGMAWAEDPPSRTRHLVGNLEATPLKTARSRRGPHFLFTARTWRPITSYFPARAKMCCAKGRWHVAGGAAHDPPRRQRPARQEPQRLPLMASACAQ